MFTIYPILSPYESLVSSEYDCTIREHIVCLSYRPCEQVFSPQNGGAYNLTSVRTSVRTYVRTSVRGQRFLISVWVNWFETLGQEQVRSEDYARQIDF